MLDTAITTLKNGERPTIMCIPIGVHIIVGQGGLNEWKIQV